MLVDNPLLQSSYFATTSAPSTYPECATDLNDIFDTDLFNSTFASSGSSSFPGSRDSSPQTLLTPPQEVLPTSFPEIHDDDSTNQFYSLFNGFDGSYGGAIGGGTDCGIGYDLGMDVSNMGMTIPPIDDPMQMRGIDPQLVDTPSAVSDHDDEPEEEQEPLSSPDVTQQPQEELSFTIAPVKVGGFGKARKGTVQSGGVAKKTPSTYVNKNKENPQSAVLSSSKRPSPPKATKPSTTSLSLANALPVSTGPFFTGDSSTAGSEAGGDDEGDLPENWRPSPEVLAKMTSKEKRQLRNKISARNFRVRRKEYITTLEGDIAERDRLLDHFRTQLGSQESENLALRQEISTLKKALLEGRGSINLPPPAPLPEQSAAESLAAVNTTTTVQSTPLLTANTQKDLPSSPRIGGPRFWGGVGIGGGVTPVHTTLVPDIGTLVRNGLQENMNPSLNAMQGASPGNEIGPNRNFGGFDGFADLNPFTMKTLDAYRMHLWGKMAAQQQMHQQSQVLQNLQNPSNLTSNMRPHFFSTSPKPNMSSPSSGYGGTLSALLSGKHNVPPSLSSSAYPTPPTSPLLLPKGGASLPSLHSSQSSTTSVNPSSSLSPTQKEQQHGMLAAMASQTVFRKLGNAFWDAFTGTSSQSSSSSSPRGDWDADKVRKVLEGKAVLRVVDVEPVTTTTPAASVSSILNTSTSTPSASPRWKGTGLRRSTASTTSTTSSNSSHTTEDNCRAKTAACVCDILEESMRSLSMGKKM